MQAPGFAFSGHLHTQVSIVVPAELGFPEGSSPATRGRDGEEIRLPLDKELKFSVKVVDVSEEKPPPPNAFANVDANNDTVVTLARCATRTSTCHCTIHHT